MGIASMLEHTRGHVEHWMRTRRPAPVARMFGVHAEVHPVPKGVVGVIDEHCCATLLALECPRRQAQRAVDTMARSAAHHDIRAVGAVWRVMSVWPGPAPTREVNPI
jgi:hypothetical protein